MSTNLIYTYYFLLPTSIHHIRYKPEDMYDTDDDLGRNTGCGQINALNNGEFTVSGL